MATRLHWKQVDLVGRKIRQLRLQQRWTQTDLAYRIGVQQSDLSRMEKGEYRVSLDVLFRLLQEFGLGFGEFFEAIALESLSPRHVRLVEDLNSLAPESRREIENFIIGAEGRRTRDRRVAEGRR